MKYFEGKIGTFVEKTVACMCNNDDLYDELVRLMNCQKDTENRLDQLVNELAYAHVAYAFRLKKLQNCQLLHGSVYDAYEHPYTDALHQLECSRDKLMDYCEDHQIDYKNAYCY